MCVYIVDKSCLRSVGMNDYYPVNSIILRLYAQNKKKKKTMSAKKIKNILFYLHVDQRTPLPT